MCIFCFIQLQSNSSSWKLKIVELVYIFATDVHIILRIFSVKTNIEVSSLHLEIGRNNIFTNIKKRMYCCLSFAILNKFLN